VLLGKYGTPESRAEYVRVLAEWEANGRRLIRQATIATPDITIAELFLAYWKHAQAYYVKNNKATSQQERVRLSLKTVRELYGHTTAKDFGPLALKAVREQMINAGLVRRHINQRVGCIKLMIKWAVEHELVPPSLYQGLQAVAGLKKGRSEAPALCWCR
jgi:hypothetical protein